MWIVAGVLSIFGENNFNYRVVDGICGLLLVTALFLFIVSIVNSPSAAAVSSLFLISAPSILLGRHGFRRATQDGALLTLTSLALIAGFYLILRLAKKNYERSHLCAIGIGLIVGCAVLIKSISGFIPLLIIIPFILFLTRYDLKRGIVLSFLIIIPSVLLPSLYFVPHFLLTRHAYNIAVSRELFQRAVDGFHNQNDFLYYIRSLFSPTLSASPLVPPVALLPSIFFGAYQSFRSSTFEHKLLYRYLTVWAILPVLLYSMAQSRLLWYIAPAVPAHAALVGLLFWHFLLKISSGAFLARLTSLIFIGGLVSLLAVHLKFDYEVILRTKTKRLAIDSALGAIRCRAREPHHTLVARKRDLAAVRGRGQFNVEAIYLRSLRERLRIVSKDTPGGMEEALKDASFAFIEHSLAVEVLAQRNGSIVALFPAYNGRERPYALVSFLGQAETDYIFKKIPKPS